MTILSRLRTLVRSLPMTILLAGAAPEPTLPQPAATPPMGWNSWNRFGCAVTEADVRGAADALVATGMRDAGYNYVVIDDCWQGKRDAHGDIQSDPKTFPSGIKALADYVHARGLRFGIYSDAGPLTCGLREGSLGHEAQDARRYAEWGVDFLKYDWCHMEHQSAPAAYHRMADALRATGRPILFSICEWGANKPWAWAPGVGQSWRTTLDIGDFWKGAKDGRHGVLDILDQQPGLESYAGPGHWNDPDMLEVGNGGMTETEYRAHFSLWAILSAPLIAGNDLSHMSAATKAILANHAVIAVDQDSLGMQGRRIARNGDTEIWVKPLAGGGRAVVLFNRGEQAQRIALDWKQLGLDPAMLLHVRDLWSGAAEKDVRGGLTRVTPAHGVAMLRIEG